MKDHLKSLSLDDLTDVQAGWAGIPCDASGQERERRLRMLNIGSMMWRRCRMHQFCQSRAYGRTYNEAIQTADRVCGPPQ
jgi:hypothetical protein